METADGWTLLSSETIGLIESQVRGKMCPQKPVFRIQESDGLGLFEEKT